MADDDEVLQHLGNLDEKTITINVDDINEQPTKVAIAAGIGLAGIVDECKTEFNPTISHDCSHMTASTFKRWL